MNEQRGQRETKLREAVMAALLHLNSSNYGIALSCLHEAIKLFDDYVRADFAAQDKMLHKKKRRRRRRSK